MHYHREEDTNVEKVSVNQYISLLELTKGYQKKLFGDLRSRDGEYSKTEKMRREMRIHLRRNFKARKKATEQYIHLPQPSSRHEPTATE